MVTLGVDLTLRGGVGSKIVCSVVSVNGPESIVRLQGRINPYLYTVTIFESKSLILEIRVNV